MFLNKEPKSERISDWDPLNFPPPAPTRAFFTKGSVVGDVAREWSLYYWLAVPLGSSCCPPGTNKAGVGEGGREDS